MGPPDLIVTAGAEEEYEVESILRHRRWGQVIEYLLYWRSYNKAKDNWVSEKDFIHAQQILQ